MSTTNPRGKETRLRVGFIASNIFQLFHYRAITAHLDADVTVYLEARDEDFGLTKEAVDSLMPGCRVTWVASEELLSIDGQCEVLVCQTPVGALTFFTRSLLVAQQYSLAKEQYQYGPWRAQANLNLMYGPYSARAVSGYATTAQVGNPLLDGHVPVEGILPAPSPAGPRLRVLYMPTYGDLSDRESVLEALVGQDVDLSIKAHHADLAMKELADRYGLRIHLSDTHPCVAIQSSDVIVSDYSGAIYDALALRTPVVLIDQFNPASASLFRLSEDDQRNANVSHLSARWRPGDALLAAYEESRSALSDDALYTGFVRTYFANFGAAGKACADAIAQLATTGDTSEWGVVQVRAAIRRYITANRELRRTLKGQERRGSKPLLPGTAKGRTVRQRVGLAIAQDSPRTLLSKAARRIRRLVPSRSPGHASPPQREFAAPLPAVPRERRAALRGLLESSLDSAGVEYRVWTSPYQSVIGVRVEDIDRVVAALTGFHLPSDESVALWVGTGVTYTRLKGQAALNLSAAAGYASIVVGAVSPEHHLGDGREAGVEIAILEPRQDRIISRRVQLEKVDWTQDFAPAAAADATRRADVAVSPSGSAQADVVYTWVDSTDPEWERDRRLWSGDTEFEMVSAANDERYLNRDELRYSIRSLWMYAPFVRNIYIVTSGQRPSWLPVDTDRIKVVSHAEIFPDPSSLPTFNSHAIEACLHRIPGLLDRFLYLNDDFFLGREVRLDDFYTQAGLIKSRFSPSSYVASERPANDAIPTDWASYNATSLMHRDFGMTFARKMKHVPYPLTRTLLDEMEGRYPEIFATTRDSRFRAHSDYAIPSMLAQYYAIATGKGVEWQNIRYEYAYADTGRYDFYDRLKSIRKRRPVFYCLNGTFYRDIDLHAQAATMREFLEERYPFPSPYEAAEPRHRRPDHA